MNSRQEQIWFNMYDYAKKYYEYYGNLDVPVKFKTNDGYTYAPDGKIDLGRWLFGQKRTKQDSKQGQLLLKIGFDFTKKLEKKWNDMYDYAKKYYEHYGNLDVPVKFKTNDGYTDAPNGKINLGRWVYEQKKLDILNDDRKKYEKLLKIGFNVEKAYEENWFNMYDYAKKYYEHYGNLNVKQKFKTNDGYTYTPDGKINLGRWLSTQRQKVEIGSKRWQLLLDIGFTFEKKRKLLPWDEVFEYAKKYYEYYNNLNVPIWFKTNDGYTHDPNGKVNLGIWISNQKKYSPLDTKRGEKLSNIGMIYKSNKNDMPWHTAYEYAKAYCKYYGNLEVPSNFKTNDGYTYAPDGVMDLGQWILKQRDVLDKESYKFNLLMKLDFNWYNDSKDIKYIDKDEKQKALCLKNKY